METSPANSSLLDIQKQFFDPKISLEEVLKLRERQFKKLRPIFLQMDPAEMIGKDKMEVVLEMQEYALGLIGFDDPEVKQHFIKMGCPLSITKWMTDVYNLTNILDQITSNGNVAFSKLRVFQFAMMYTQSKICAAIHLFYTATVYDGENTSMIAAEFLKKFRRERDNGGVVNQMNAMDTFISAAIEEFVRVIPKDFPYQSFIRSHMSGNTDCIYLNDIFKCFSAPQIRDRDLNMIIFPLFILICKDKNLMTKEEFDSLKNKKGKQGYIDYTSYRSYVAGMMRSIRNDNGYS